MVLMDEAHPSELAGAASSSSRARSRMRGASRGLWVEHRSTTTSHGGKIMCPCRVDRAQDHPTCYNSTTITTCTTSASCRVQTRMIKFKH
jgi:hypothetical protein